MLERQARGGWRKSSYSAITNHCVEVCLTDAVEVRDSKDRSGPILCFGPGEWTDFIAAIKEGAFDAGR